MLLQLVKRKREKDGDVLLEEMLSLPEYEDLLLAIKHNKFGGVMLNANNLEKAETHFIKSLEVIEKKYKIPYSNIHMNLGNLWGQRHEYKQAIKHYLQVIEDSPYNPQNAEIKLPAEGSIDSNKYSAIIFSPKLNNEEAYIDAHSNLAVMHIQTDEIEKAFSFCQKALELQPGNQ